MIRNTPIDQPGTGIGISGIVDLRLVTHLQPNVNMLSA